MNGGGGLKKSSIQAHQFQKATGTHGCGSHGDFNDANRMATSPLIIVIQTSCCKNIHRVSTNLSL